MEGATTYSHSLRRSNQEVPRPYATMATRQSPCKDTSSFSSITLPLTMKSTRLALAVIFQSVEWIFSAVRR